MSGTLMLPSVPELVIVDLSSEALSGAERAAGLRQWEALHLRYFPTYPHIVDEVDDWFSHGWPDHEVCVHPFLGTVDGEPALQGLMHTNLRRRISIMIHLAATEDLRARAPRGLLIDVVPLWLALGSMDCARGGVKLSALAAEVPPDHLPKWFRQGFGRLGVHYGEPLGGRLRHREADPVFSSIQPILRLTEAGAREDYGDVAYRAMSALLLDYYDLPRDQPRVAQILTEAARLHMPTAMRVTDLHQALEPPHHA